MEEKEVCGILGRAVKRLRQQNGWTQEFLAEKLDVSPNFLSNIENGKAWVSSKTVGNLSFIFNIAPYELFVPDKPVPLTLADEQKRYKQTIKTALTSELTRFLEKWAE